MGGVGTGSHKGPAGRDVWELTLEECRLGWLGGPLARGEVEVAEAVPAARFLVRNPGKLDS